MPDVPSIDLVKLANLGAAGICIFIVLAVGKVVMGLPDTTPPEKHKTIRYYMKLCGFVAVVTLLSGAANAYFNANKVATAQTVAKTATADATLASKRADAAKVGEAAAVKLAADTNTKYVESQKAIKDINEELTKLRPMILETKPELRDKFDLLHTKVDVLSRKEFLAPVLRGPP